MLLMMNAMDDKERWSFQQVYERNYRIMYYVALRIVKNRQEAEDAVHNAFVKLAERFDRYRTLPEEEMTSLCVVIVKNKCLDVLRSADNRLCQELDKVEFSVQVKEQCPLENLIGQEETEELSRVLHRLPEGLRIVLELKYYHEYSNSEIAQILDIRKKTVELRLYRAKKKMKEMLQSEERRETV